MLTESHQLISSKASLHPNYQSVLSPPSSCQGGCNICNNYHPTVIEYYYPFMMVLKKTWAWAELLLTDYTTTLQHHHINIYLVIFVSMIKVFLLLNSFSKAPSLLSFINSIELWRSHWILRPPWGTLFIDDTSMV